MMSHETAAKTAKRSGRRPVIAFFGVLALVVGIAIAAGVLPRISREKGLVAAATARERQVPVVIASAAHLAPGSDTIDLPGDLQSIVESPIFARADGYLKTRSVDIGDHVKTGQLMAELETPELDQQIAQARATLAQAQASLKELEADIELSRANLNLSKVTQQRWQRLADKGVVSRQDLDEKSADLSVKQAQADRAVASLATAQETVRASDANLHRLDEMKSFARVTAPFDSVVTARNVDIGTLINAGNGGASREMFRVARIQPIRIFVNVPQTYVEEIRDGQAAELRVQERPGEVFPAKVTNVSHSLDTNSRSMLVILESPNPGSVLFPGMYAQVRFPSAAHAARPLLRIPSDTLIIDKSGTRVAVVDARKVVHFRNITVGQDLGSEMEVISGLKLGELVVSNPSDVVQEGAGVEVKVRK
ncbi:MAG TPA: efflux RND transporter periplasmic adaptor subunit [Bryobacteraceae bacterium]|nr:efflux RND transporter periplasmic adaptor subunit [Bryobacteraceae bacterium]